MNEIDQFGLNEQDVQAPDTQVQHEFIEKFVGKSNEEIGNEIAIDNTYYLQTESPLGSVVGYTTTSYTGEQTPEVVRAKEINISPLPHGYLVRIGCQSFAFEDHKKMMKYINAYLDNPAKVEKKFYANTLFKK